MMKTTKLMSTVALVALMGASTLLADKPLNTNDGFSNTAGDTWMGKNALNFDGTVATVPDGTLLTVIGFNAGRDSTGAATNNTFVGAFTGQRNTSGRDNTNIGAKAGEYNQLGERNVFLGYEAGRYEMGGDKLYISNSETMTPLIYGEFGNGFEDTNASLEINGDTYVNGYLDVNGTATVTFSGEGDGTAVHSLLVLDVNDTAAGAKSEAAFVLKNSKAGKEWLFRTLNDGTNFAFTLDGTGGAEFAIENNSTDFNNTKVIVGGVTIFENGQLVNAALEARIKALEDAQ